MQKTADWFSTPMAIPHPRPSGYRTTKTPLAKHAPAVANLRYHRKQIVTVMRLTILLLTVALLNVQASGLSQTVTLTGKDIPLRKVFSVIKEQTGYVVFGNNSLFANTRPVTVNADKMPLTSFLNLVLTNQPLTYSIDGKTIFIAAQALPLPESKPEPGKIGFDLFPDQGREVWGLLRNLSGEPLGGASITNKRTKKGTSTNASGYFRLKDVETGDTLIASFIGYKTAYVRVGESAEVLIHLQLAENQLDQVVIQGYGTTTRRTGTGAITKVSGDEISKANVVNPMLALQGRVPGLVVTPEAGYVSGRIKMEIRGRKSLSRDFTGDPLVIIDGVPMTVLELGPISFENGGQGLTQGLTLNPAGGQNPFFGLNPADIESIEVLRDADATAIYGSRGSNGVILVTSKKGSNKGGAIFNMNVNTGVNLVTSRWDMLNTQEYLQIRKAAFANDGIEPTFQSAPDLKLWDTTRYTDWQKELWGNRGKSTFVDASLGGGNEFTTYRLSGGYSSISDITTKAGSNDVYNLQFSLGHTSLTRKFRMNFVGKYTRTEVKLRMLPSTTTLAPNAPPIYAPDGRYNFKEYNDAGRPDDFPFGVMENAYKAGTNLMNLSLNLSYDILNDLKASVNIGYSTSDNNTSMIIPIAGQNVDFYGQFAMGTSNMSSTNVRNWIIEPQLNYRLRFGLGRIDAIAGASYQTNTTNSVSNLGMLYTNDAFLGSLSLAPYLMGQSLRGQYKYGGVFGRLSFNWDEKYIVNLNGRRDGSSRFGKNNQFGNFGSIGASWIASEEKWIRNWLPEEVTLLKFRTTYGLVGSDQVGDYRYITQWSNTVPGFDGLFYQPYDGLNPLVSQLHVNEDYHWQLNKKLDLGLSAGFINDRILLEYTYYKERIEDQLTDFPVPYSTGFPTVTANFPAVLQNSGHEIQLLGRVIENKQFKLGLNFNIAFNRNKLASYPDFEHSPFLNFYTIGRSVNTVYLLHYLGVNPQTGQYSFEDANKNGVINIRQDVPMLEGHDDRSVAIDLAPKYTGGFGANLSYRNWSMNLQFSFMRKFIRNVAFPSEYLGRMSNVSKDILGNYWEKPGDVKRFAAPTTLGNSGNSFFGSSDGYYMDMKMLRLGAVNIAYSFPDSWMQKIRMRSGSVFLRSGNLFFISNTEGLDPESTGVGAMPMARSITAGFSLSL
ncbi:SusC/RagA family TonB-linked outer membrane protein [Pseudoflavitalea rhizosphaerae]|uniref:SusC/RagA family TonB-linked outer membrane protein n=1 Tax=Pseudoflavitalea rhizosphaerae TaxID=1884793 RepID=UPI0013DF9EA1|nr:SusC/RagA family TonB-linked outer membrane protein [Pseudoflavitalea rhizosphaerae]